MYIRIFGSQSARPRFRIEIFPLVYPNENTKTKVQSDRVNLRNHCIVSEYTKFFYMNVKGQIDVIPLRPGDVFGTGV